MIKIICNSCLSEFDKELEFCPNCESYDLDKEELSDCCSARIISEIWLCSDCKEPC